MKTKRVIYHIPEIKGCYGPRLWVDDNDIELIAFLRLICLWGGPTNTRVVENQRQQCWELPIGTFENDLWKQAAARLDISLI